MSTTTQALDFRTALNTWLGHIVEMYTQDIHAIPDDQWNATFGGCTRPASDLTGDALFLLDWTAEVLKGNSHAAVNLPEAVKAWVEKCGTKESATTHLQRVAKEFSQAFTNATDEALQRAVTAPWGRDVPLFAIANIAVNHLWYHDGQLNYIQCLLGDEKVHWMET